ncbi:hypothetical protein FB567DRAFT_442309, partial [Paraphoma chrysanthemicola]
FLVERAHALRAPYMRRTKDWLWIVGASSIVFGFGGIAVVAFMWPLSDISAVDGRCRMGLLRRVTMPILAFDVVINILLTIVFIYLLNPVIRSNSLSLSGCSASRVADYIGSCCRKSRKKGVQLRTANPHVARRLKKLLWRTFIGSCLVLIPTAGNLAQLTVLQGRELGFVCLTICTLDVTWSCSVFHWLVTSSDADEKFSTESVPR